MERYCELKILNPSKMKFQIQEITLTHDYGERLCNTPATNHRKGKKGNTKVIHQINQWPKKQRQHTKAKQSKSEKNEHRRNSKLKVYLPNKRKFYEN